MPAFFIRFVVALLVVAVAGCRNEAAKRPIVVGSKNFTESVILGELVAQALEKEGCTVDRKLNMGGTLVCDTAITSGQLDTYVEYSGTALTAILRKPIAASRAEVDTTVRSGYEARGLKWGPNLGFNNTFAIIIRRADAEQLGIRTISDLARVADRFQPGFGFEFNERPDGWRGLQQKYGFTSSKTPKTMDLGLTYKALAAGEVDVIAGNSTDGLIEKLGLVMLADDRAYFPPYDAAIVRRRDIGGKCAGADKALDALAGRLDEQSMRRINYAVDGEKKDVAAVAGELLGK